MRATVMKVAGLLLVAAGWLMVLRGLFLLPVSNDPHLDLDAGPAFAINISVYLPVVVLTVLLAVAVPLAAATSRGAQVGVAISAVVGAFVYWVMTQEPLMQYLPGLRSSLLVAAGLVAAGLLVLCLTLATTRPAVPAPAPAPLGVDG